MLAKYDVAVRIMVMLLPALIYVMPAPSQGQGSPDSAKPADRSQAPRAPVGHRQPTAADIPKDGAKDRPKDAAEVANEKRERELDAKLQICRGC